MTRNHKKDLTRWAKCGHTLSRLSTSKIAKELLTENKHWPRFYTYKGMQVELIRSLRRRSMADNAT